MAEPKSPVGIISESLLKMFNTTFKQRGKQYLVKEPRLRRVNERKATISFEIIVPDPLLMTGVGISQVLRAIHKLSFIAKEHLKPIEITMTPTKEGFECLVSIVARRLR